MSRRALCLLLLLTWRAGADDAPTAWTESFRVQTPATQTLRGFGRVASEAVGYQSGARRVWMTSFACTSAELAGVVIGKFLADLSLSPHVEAVRVASAPAVATAGGAVFVGCVQGAAARVLCAGSQADLTAFAAGHAELLAGAVERAPYPLYLDRFDRYGWGLYGLDGYRGTHDWMTKTAQLDGRPGLKDPKEDFDWLVKLNNRFEPHLDPSQSLGNADGLIANADDDWEVKLAREAGLGLSFRLYGSAHPARHGWLLRRFGEYQNRPAEFLTPRVDSYAVELMQSWYARDAHRYQAVKAYEMVKKYADEPHVLGWMHPYGEIQVGTWEYDHGDYGPHARASWQAYLRAHGCDLAEATRLYQRTTPFGDWEQVPVPEFATFAGLDGQVADLGGQWWSRPEVTVDQRVDDAWWARPPTQRYQGLREQWWQGAVDATLWQPVTAPGGGGLPGRSSWTCTTWFRRGFTLTPAQLQQAPVYLYFFPLSGEGIHSGAHRRYHELWVNGEPAGEVGSWGALDVTRLLRPGDNQVALRLHGSQWQGRIFLSTEAPRIFPALGEGKNRLWVLWRSWLVDAPIEAMRMVLEGMRQADPNRPIKVMAPLRLGASRYVPLAHDYGVFPHFTGEGMWYFPWYKRYAWLYDVPGSSETSQPAPMEQTDCGEQFDSYRRVFMAGLNAHDPVFFGQTYSRSPYLRRWWEEHQAVLHQLGRYDLAGPQVLLFRGDTGDTGLTPRSPYPAIGASSRYVHSQYDWDLGRGTLQTLGQSYVYLNERSIADGKMNGYKVMFDCGNELLGEQTRDQLAAWVRAGGTFVALPFTGRSSLLALDSWPISALNGCRVARFRTPGTGTVTLKPGQPLFPTCAGRTFPDAGSSMDWVGNELNKYSVELEPGADCEVLATYENGAPAVVRRRLGQGSVLTFGSVFWRHSQDRRGIWWPQSPEPEVLGDLLDGLGQSASCETDGQLVWPQPYRSNNGLDAVTVLTSWNDDKAVTSTLRLRLPARPAALVSFGVDGEHDLPFDWANGVATTKVPMPAKEVKVIRALGTVEPHAAVGHWWGYQQRLWHELVQPTLDLEPYRHGKFADPTVDLRPDARFTGTRPVDDKWREPGFDDRAWTRSPLSLFRFWGAVPGQPLWVRKSFVVPAEWRRRAGQMRVVTVLGGGRYDDHATVWINGVSVAQLGRDFADNHYDVDATRVLRPGENVLALEYPGNTPVQAVQGEVFLYFRAEPVKSLPLATGSQTVFIPRAWEGKYRVTLYLEGERYCISKAGINRHDLLRGRPYPAPAEYNLDAYLKYGADNQLWVNPGKSPADVRVSRLDLFPLDE